MVPVSLHVVDRFVDTHDRRVLYGVSRRFDLDRHRGLTWVENSFLSLTPVFLISAHPCSDLILGLTVFWSHDDVSSTISLFPFCPCPRPRTPPGSNPRVSPRRLALSFEAPVVRGGGREKGDTAHGDFSDGNRGARE